MLTEEPGRTVSEVAENLGTKDDILYRWRRQLKRTGEIVFPGHGKMILTPDQMRIRDLEKKLKDTEMERDILKKPWSSSAGHRNEVSLCKRVPLFISGGEDVPVTQRFSERLLSLAECSLISTKNGESPYQTTHL
jgi:transposase